jgi:hypothetical protein
MKSSIICTLHHGLNKKKDKIAETCRAALG